MLVLVLVLLLSLAFLLDTLRGRLTLAMLVACNSCDSCAEYSHDS